MYVITGFLLIVVEEQMFMFDFDLLKLVSFPFTKIAGSPNRTIWTINYPGNRTDLPRPLFITSLSYDRVRKLLYAVHPNGPILILLNVTKSGIVTTSISLLKARNGFVLFTLGSVLVDESSGSFYVAEKAYGAIVKFEYNSTIGTVIAGKFINPLLSNQLEHVTSLAFDSSGYIYAVDMNRNRIVQLVGNNGELRIVAGVSFFIK